MFNWTTIVKIIIFIMFCLKRAYYAINSYKCIYKLYSISNTENLRCCYVYNSLFFFFFFPGNCIFISVPWNSLAKNIISIIIRVADPDPVEKIQLLIQILRRIGSNFVNQILLAKSLAWIKVVICYLLRAGSGCGFSLGLDPVFLWGWIRFFSGVGSGFSLGLDPVFSGVGSGFSLRLDPVFLLG